ncbi:hypothetical protein C7H09_19345 [Marinobacter fuscus]|uniref:Uncharacterized protein n=2 Tax=Marinobacter fuscus TaxID=2109942 RepID=A0A2T1K3D0_9GAMM|nr:hypothetical protein C7H09_19345 [Marinobacter fuscus]
MSPGLVFAGTLGQITLAYLLFMVAVFGFSAVSNTHRPTPLDSRILDSAFYILPGSCLLSAVAVIGLYWAGASSRAYLWYTAPVILFLIYCIYAQVFIPRKD